ncbi:MAG TPA: KpsF/GutQ family sugar-phosphate isomerase [Candidatus Polarisedimenticolia bacterium]|jgi:arabinose-5-phosphate isomerase|nr:KpsF/GutQ family sugar-phosphate isomerase [Candidatus Polarisedimenticolia bacterium]
MVRDLARRVLELEARSILDLVPRLGDGFDRAVELLHGCGGRVVVTGMGKSGLIGAKIAATFSSTGTPSIFLHPAEAVHGDIGMLMKGDLALAISYSGETEELVRLLEILKRFDIGLIALTGGRDSTLARHALVTLDVGIEREASPLGLVPTASTTAALAMGDALAMALVERRGFSLEDFARNHPGGRLGRKVLTVGHLMHPMDAIPRVAVSDTLPHALEVMNAHRLGMTCVVSADGALLGVITDGDLRRALLRGADPRALKVTEVMSATPVTIGRGELAAAALSLMEGRRITSLVVVTPDRIVDGVLHLHDLWRTQLF